MSEDKPTLDFSDNNIELYFHCQLCMKSMPKGESPQSWGRLEAGWTKQGLQLWCKRHLCNVIHVDFEGQKHPASTSRVVTEEEMKDE